MPTSITSSSSVLVSPLVATYSPGAYINIDSEQSEEVRITGINETFTHTLTGDDLKNFMKGFKVSGFSIDTRLGKNDFNYDNFDVTLGVENAAAFKSVLDDIIANATSDASHNLVAAKNAPATNDPDRKIGSYLHAELYNAFVGAFGNLIGPSSADIIGSGSYASGPITGQGASAGPDPVMDAGVNGTSSADLTTVINSFALLVDMDASAAAAEMISQHAAAAGHGAVASLFRQIGKSKILTFMDPASEPHPEERTLTTTSLPLVAGDKIVFVFDIDVKAAGANTTGETGTAAGGADIPASNTENVPAADTQTPPYSNTISFNLANRRVAFEITLGGEGDADADLLVAP